jgi:hypothetical protein
MGKMKEHFQHEVYERVVLDSQGIARFTRPLISELLKIVEGLNEPSLFIDGKPSQPKAKRASQNNDREIESGIV